MTEPEGPPGNAASHRSRRRSVAFVALALTPGCFAACWIDGLVGFWLWLLGLTSACLARMGWLDGN